MGFRALSSGVSGDSTETGWCGHGWEYLVIPFHVETDDDDDDDCGHPEP